MTSLLSRIGAWFVEPPESAAAVPAQAAAPPTRFLPPASHPAGTSSDVEPVDRTPSDVEPADGTSSDVEPADGTLSDVEPAATAAVLGAPALVVPLAAACAGELRTRAGKAAALLCIWRPALPAHCMGGVEPTASPAGATTPGARRLAARLVAHELPATACGRLAWLSLDHDAVAGAEQVRRCLRTVGAPVVLAVAGARPPAFEPLLAELDLALVVLAADIDAALRDLALATLPARARAVLPPLPPGPPRWAAMAGLARLRALPRGGA
jgi:hypothetical protein